tara:strand:+ start:291 stop:785 length:495 start_codon:yes stop_codon:yes gene_type:complete
MNTYSLFATTVIHSKIIIQPDLHKKILTYVNKELNLPATNMRSVINGHQFHDNFDGKEDLNKLLNNYFINNFQLKIESSWLNVLNNNSYNKPHAHGGNKVCSSVVFYLSHNNNNITFVKDTKTFEIKPGLFDYLLFPHNLVHYVLPEERAESRISYALNLERIE